MNQSLGEAVLMFVCGVVTGVLIWVFFFEKDHSFRSPQDSSIKNSVTNAVSSAAQASPALPTSIDDSVSFFGLQVEVEGTEWRVQSAEIAGKPLAIAASQVGNPTLVLVAESPKDETLTLHLVRRQSGKVPPTLTQPVEIKAGKYTYNVSVRIPAIPPPELPKGPGNQTPKQSQQKPAAKSASNNVAAGGSKSSTNSGTSAASNGESNKAPKTGSSPPAKTNGVANQGSSTTPRSKDAPGPSTAPGPNPAPTPDGVVKPALTDSDTKPKSPEPKPDDAPINPQTPPHVGER